MTRRLAAIARNPEQLLPPWIRDPRYAAAACYLAASLTLALAGDASAIFRQATDTVSTKARTLVDAGDAVSTSARTLVDAGEAKGFAAWGAAAASVGRGLGRGRHEVARYRASVERLYAGTVRTIDATTRELIPDRPRSVEGDDDDGSRKDG